MSSQEKKEEMTLTLMEAIETLSHIADLEIDQNLGAKQPENIPLTGAPLAHYAVHWLKDRDATVTMSVIKDTFRVVHKYLQNFYQNEYSERSDAEVLERIKTIMVLVGEAAKNLDRYTALFQKVRISSVTDLKEYRQLQKFYQSHISLQVDRDALGGLVLALSQRTPQENKIRLVSQGTQQANHIFIDLDSVKKDTEYELFFLRKEDGSRFFSPRLIRNIKLVSDFEGYLKDERKEDPLIILGGLPEKKALAQAKAIVHATRDHIDHYLQVAVHATENQLVRTLNNALIGLFMAANPSNILHHIAVKDCLNYFHDFQLFLRQCLTSQEYQRMVAYPSEKPHKLDSCVLKLLHSLCETIYTQLGESQELQGIVHELVQHACDGLAKDHKESIKESKTIAGTLGGEYAALAKLMKHHPNGPLNRILTDLSTGEYRGYDPLLQYNLPTLMYSAYVNDSKCLFARWPTPTNQEFINKVSVNEEFKAFLRACGHEQAIGKCLLFNFQDRLTWKEHFRCAALEELSAREVFGEHFEVVTLTKDTEFYHQQAPYSTENHAEVFMANFREQLGDPSCGFFIPKKIAKELSRGFIVQAMEAVHRIFFSKKNVLTKEDRLNFIELFYLFLELKIMDCVKPDLVGFSCKDGLDITLSAGAELFVFFKLLNQERLSEFDRENLDLMLYGPCLLDRERLLMPERFNRMLGAIKVIETVRDQYGFRAFTKIVQEAFGMLYNTPIFTGKIQ